MKILVIRGKAKESGNNDDGWYYGYTIKKLGHTVKLINAGIYHRQWQVYFQKGTQKIFNKSPINIYRNTERSLLKEAREFKPDLILDTYCKTITPTALKRIRKLVGCPIVAHFSDNPFFYDPPFSAIENYDHFFVKDSFVVDHCKLLGLNNVSYLPQAAHPDFHKPIKLTEKDRDFYGSDLSFVGSLYPYRVKIFEALEGRDFKIWGTGWWGGIPKNHFVFKVHQRRGVVQEEKSKVFCASKININTQNFQNDINSVSSKAFQVACAGGFQIIDYKKDLKELFRIGKEIVVFNDRDELIDKVDKYLSDEKSRKRIAEAGMKRARNEHTFEKRFKEIKKTLRI